MTFRPVAIAACIGCSRLELQLQGCAHEPSPWARLMGSERIGVCSTCPPALVAAWDAGQLEPDQVKRALAVLPPLPHTLPPDPEKLTPRMNTRLKWFALNYHLEKPA